MKSLFRLLIFFVISFVSLLITSNSNGVHASLISPVQIGSKIGGTSGEQANSIKVDTSGNIYIVGSFASTSIDFDPNNSIILDTKTSVSSSSDIFIAKYNSTNVLQWIKTVGSSSSDSAIEVFIDTSENVYVTGHFQGTSIDFDTDNVVSGDTVSSNGSEDIFLVKYNLNGILQWVKAIGSTTGTGNQDKGFGVYVDGSGNVFLCGVFNNTVDFDRDNVVSNDTKTATSSFANDGFFAKYNSSGTLQWVKQIGGTFGNDGLLKIGLDNSGNIITTGYMESNNVDYDRENVVGGDTKVTNGQFVAKYDSSGTLIWVKVIASGVIGLDGLNLGLTIDSTGNIYLGNIFQGTNIDFDQDNVVSGDIKSSVSGSGDIYFAKYNSSGTLQWLKTVGGSGTDWLHDLTVDSLGNIYITGVCPSGVDFDPDNVVSGDTPTGGTSDLYIAKYNSSRVLQWVKFFGSNFSDTGESVFIDNSNYLYVAGIISGTASNTVDLDPANSLSGDTVTLNGNGDIFYAKYFTDISYQIQNLTSSLDTVNTNSNSIKAGTRYGAVSSTEVVRLKDNDNGLVISDITVNMTIDRTWSGVSGDSSSSLGKSFVSGLVVAPGASSTHILYIPKYTWHQSVIICPLATTLAEVTDSCSGGVRFLHGETKTVNGVSVTVTKTTISSQEYWVATGVNGSGGLSLNDVFGLQDLQTRLQVSINSNHQITFGTINGLLVSGNTIALQFDPAGQNYNLGSLTFSDIDLEDDGVDLTLAAAAGVSTWGVNINTSTDTITFTAPTSGSGYIAAGSIIVVKIGTGATFGATGTNQITNPASVNSYLLDITITNSGIESALIPMATIDDDTVQITAQVAGILSFDIDTTTDTVATTGTQCDVAGGSNPCDSHGGASDNAGYVVDLGQLTTSSVTNSGDTVLHSDSLTGVVNSIALDIETNASNGFAVTMVSLNDTLNSGTYSIPSVVAGPTTISAGDGRYGIRVMSTTTTSGSFTIGSAYSGSAGQYGKIADAGIPIVIVSSTSLISGGRVLIEVGVSPDAGDGTGTYTDQLTFICTATF